MPAASNSLKTSSCDRLANGPRDEYGLSDLVGTYLATGMFDTPNKNRFASAFRQLYFRSESSERLKAVECLASTRATPEHVVALVCCDQAEIASIMLAQSPVLSEAELTTQILQGNMLHRRAIAQRNDLSSVLISQLLFFGEAEVARQLMPYADHLPDLSQRLCEVAARDQNGTISERGRCEMTEQVDKSGMAPAPKDGACQDIDLPDGPNNQAQDPLNQDLRSGLFAVDTPKSLYIDPNEHTAQFVNVWQALHGKADNHLSTEFHYPPSHPMPLTVAGLEESTQDMTGSKSHGPDVADLATEQTGLEAHIDQGAADTGDLAFEDLSDEELEARFASGDFEELVSEEEEKEPRRVSFRIGVNDEDNAPIPSLDPFSYDRDNGSISIQRQDDTAALEPNGASVSVPVINGRPENQAAPSITPQPVTKAKPAEQCPSAPSLGQKLLEEQRLAEEARADILLAKMHDHKTSEEDKALGAQITLTVRKRNQEDKSTDDGERLDAPKTSVTLSSTTENDWESALADLAKEFEPSEIERASLIKTERQVEKAPPVAEAEPRIVIRRNSSNDGEGQPVPAENEALASEVISDPETISPTEAQAKGSAPIIASDSPINTLIEVAPQADIFAHMDQMEQASPVPIDEDLIHEHAPFGFMPDMVTFDGLELVEAEPDLPSATELLLRQRAAPLTELVEPEEVHFSDHSLSSAMTPPAPTAEHNVMMQVTEQLAREKQARRYVEAKAAEAINPVTHSVLAQKASEPSCTEAQETEEADADTKTLDELPAFADHQLVDEATFAKLKEAERAKGEAATAGPNNEAPKTKAVSISLSRPMSNQTLENLKGGQGGMAAQFFAYDTDTRLELLQAMLAGSLADQAMHNQRPYSLDDEQARALISARFSNDRLSLVELLHNLSGHLRMDLAELLQDQGGEALVVYLYYIGLDESRALSFVLHGPDAIAHDYNKVSQLMTLFEQLYPAAAERIITQLLGGASKGKGQATHLPIHDNGDDAKSARLRQSSIEQQDTNEREAPVFGRRQNDR